MVSLVEVLLSVFILLVAWMRVSTANRETAYEFEHRLHTHFGEGTANKVLNNDSTGDIKVCINQVFFQESSDLLYLVKRSFWPWQDIDGNTVFDINTIGFVIEDIDEFEATLRGDDTIQHCHHENHDDHYIVTVKGVPDVMYYRMQSFETIFYYIANADLSAEYYEQQHG